MRRLSEPCRYCTDAAYALVSNTPSPDHLFRVFDVRAYVLVRIETWVWGPARASARLPHIDNALSTSLGGSHRKLWVSPGAQLCCNIGIGDSYALGRRGRNFCERSPTPSQNWQSAGSVVKREHAYYSIAWRPCQSNVAMTLT